MAMRAQLKALREKHVEDVMATAREVVRTESPSDSGLVDMCDYHLATGGKRLRAVLPLAVAEALGAEPTSLYPFAAACELLHNATLVHDDLQDGDELRRGEPTVWRRFGPERAVNLGDAMLYWPLQCLDRLQVDDGDYRRCVRRFVRQVLTVIDGQEREFELMQAEAPTAAEYVRLVQGKTGGLFALAAAGAAELSDASVELVDALDAAATELGVLFQIQDDLLDLYGDKGRDERGADLREGKISALVVHFFDEGPDDQVERLRALLRADRDAVSAADVDAMAEAFRRAGSLEAALAEIEERRRAALQAPVLDEHETLQSLIAGLADLFLAPIEHLTTPPKP